MKPQTKPTDPLQMRYDIANCRTDQELNDLRDSNLDYLNQHPYLFLVIKDARKRIGAIRRMKFECTPISEMN